jgi:ATP-dependent Lon protease
MEVIELPGYIEDEKYHIAKQFLVPRQIEEHGLTAAHIKFSDEAIRLLIREYTREAGVRNLEREIGTICRKVAKQVAEAMPADEIQDETKDERPKTNGAIVGDGKPVPVELNTEPLDGHLPELELETAKLSEEEAVAVAVAVEAVEDLEAVSDMAPTAQDAEKTSKRIRARIIREKDVAEYLGAGRFSYGLAEEQDEVGVATGVSWTPVGGDTIGVEVSLMEGKGNLLLTGQLGDVMKESAQAALTYARSRARQLGIDPVRFEKTDIHIHVPAGATPKDGPSAGVTLATALVSALTGRPVRRDVAMTGEITLRGKVLPIGGLKEKVLAAHRAGISTFILPRKNEKDLDEIPQKVRRGLEMLPVDELDSVLRIALQPLSSATETRSDPSLPPKQSTPPRRPGVTSGVRAT